MAAREVDAQIEIERRVRKRYLGSSETCLLYTSDAADE